MAEVNIYIGDKLRQRRKKLNLSQDDLARMLGISNQQIHKYEAGINKLSASLLFTCAKLLHVPITYFFEGMPLNNNIKMDCSNNLRCTRNTPLAILLVEDNPVDEMLVKEALTTCDKRTTMHTIHDGKEAIQFLRKKKSFYSFPRPDIIFLDLNMPKNCGLDILKEIKNDREIMDIPVIILTNSINPDDMLKSYKMGACGFMSKSFDINEFNKNIASIVNCWSQAMVLPSMQNDNYIENLIPVLQEA